MRYYNQRMFVNAHKAYKKYLEERGMKNVRQYNTPKFKHPTVEDMKNFRTIKHIWKTGDRFHKLASEYYQKPEMWWVIALFNQAPTEFHVKLGDIIHIPVPLETAIYYMGY
jgi:nucleoid-associated protein YgaU